MANIGGLGKGISSLLSLDDISEAGKPSRMFSCPIEKITINPHQPRKVMEENSLEELTNSIREKGILQPLIVRENNNGYELIAGERRWRAAQRAGLKFVPVIIKDVEEIESLELALIENIQRENLNPVEEAVAYKKLSEVMGLTQEEISKRVGKNRSTIANFIRLLDLSIIFQEDLLKGSYTTGHARAILSVDDETDRLFLREQIITKSLSVRETEAKAKSLNMDKEKKFSSKKHHEQKKHSESPDIKNLCDRISSVIGCRVSITHKKDGGKLEIHYKNLDELERVLESLKVTDR